MSTTNSEQSQEAMRRTLAHRAGAAPDAASFAEAIISIWHQMAVLLEQVIGARGVDVLFRRSLNMTGNAFPWLLLDGDHGTSAALLESLKERLTGRSLDDAAKASYTLLKTFTDLLATLIGTSLTERLLSSVWESPSPLSEQEGE